MRLTEKQAIILFDIAKYSIRVSGGFGGYTNETIRQVVDQILNQQSDDPVELDKTVMR